MNKKFNILFVSLALVALDSCGDNVKTTYTRQNGESCDSVNNCVSGLVCDNGICRKTCVGDNDCGKGFFCKDSICLLDENYDSCGNGQEDPGEQCDDGNNNAGDGCSPRCNVEENYVCPRDSWPSICEKLKPSCGNGQEDTGEQCDDGNTIPGDGCNDKCNIEDNYTCSKGWPSICSCNEGYQDSNSDGICQPDCEQQCIGDYICHYTATGAAIGCGCPAGTQDSNSDGFCLPVCNCPDTQECSYDAAGVAQCYCPAGTQDFDGDGICKDDCTKLMAAGGCGDFKGCDDSSGEAVCRCAVYVVEGDSSGEGNSWNSPLSSISQALETMNKVVFKSYLDSNENSNIKCSVWWYMAEPVSLDVTLKDVALAGFATRAAGINQRQYLEGAEISVKDSKFKIEGEVVLDSIGFSGKSSVTVQNADLSAVNCKFEKMSTGITAVDSKVKINKSQFVVNTRGLNISGGNLIVNDSAFLGNSGSSAGNAMLISGAKATISNSYFAGNTNGGAGDYVSGAIHSTNGSELVIDNSRFVENKCDGYTIGYGGAVSNIDSSLTVTNSVFYHNEAKSSYDATYGGAIYSSSGINSKLSIKSTIFTENNAYSPGQKTFGGTIYSETNDALFDGIYILNTKLPVPDHNDLFGGGMYLSGKNSIVTNSVIAGMESVFETSGGSSGSAIYSGVNGSVKIAYSLLIDNEVPSYGFGEASVYGEKNNGVIIFNSIHDNFSESNNRADAKVSLQNSVYADDVLTVEPLRGKLDERNNDDDFIATIIVDSQHWDTDQLKGFLLRDSIGTYYPILANGPASIDIFTTLPKYQLRGVDLKLVKFKTEKLIDQASANDGPQPLTDIRGNARLQGGAPDIGPVEYK